MPDHLEARLKRYEALVKVTGDKRFTEDSSSDTQDALSEKRKERDELRGALISEIERAFLDGTIFYGGQEIDLDGAADLKEPIDNALTNIIPNIYPRFSLADRSFDFGKDLKALLNPARTKLHTVASELNPVRHAGQSAARVGPRVPGAGGDQGPGGRGHRSDGKPPHRRQGQQGIQRVRAAALRMAAEIIRLVLAACFRAGAVYLERQTSTGPDPVYDYQGNGGRIRQGQHVQEDHLPRRRDQPHRRADQAGGQSAHRDGRHRHAGVGQCDRGGRA